jgi:uncharacterized RDD family membrane protein YckC
MRCPKCHYISFGSAERCRNCGYELALAADVKPVDLPIHNPDEPVGPLSDFVLTERPSASADAPPNERESSPRRAGASRLDLPLFADRAPSGDDDAPLVSPSAVPRPPLSVRRAPPAIVKSRQDRLPADDDVEPDGSRRIGVDTNHAEADGRQSTSFFRSESDLAAAREASHTFTTAPIFARLLAGLVDVIILAGIDLAVLYFTLRVLELSFAELQLLPPVPLAVFLLLLDGGYVASFTAAGGQTIGKMIAGIRVVAQPTPDDDATRVGFGAAVLRATAYIVSLLPAGLGFVPILFDPDGRSLHDRLANTRVVKA